MGGGCGLLPFLRESLMGLKPTSKFKGTMIGLAIAFGGMAAFYHPG